MHPLFTTGCSSFLPLASKAAVRLITDTTYDAEMLMQQSVQDPHQMACCQQLIFTTNESGETGVDTSSTSAKLCIPVTVLVLSSIGPDIGQHSRMVRQA